jgi:hypothetical protein
MEIGAGRRKEQNGSSMIILIILIIKIQPSRGSEKKKVGGMA